MKYSHCLVLTAVMVLTGCVSHKHHPQKVQYTYLVAAAHQGVLQPEHYDYFGNLRQEATIAPYEQRLIWQGQHGYADLAVNTSSTVGIAKH